MDKIFTSDIFSLKISIIGTVNSLQSFRSKIFKFLKLVKQSKSLSSMPHLVRYNLVKFVNFVKYWNDSRKKIFYTKKLNMKLLEVNFTKYPKFNDFNLVNEIITVIKIK